jgi:hypothetical protein
VPQEVSELSLGISRACAREDGDTGLHPGGNAFGKVIPSNATYRDLLSRFSTVEPSPLGTASKVQFIKNRHTGVNCSPTLALASAGGLFWRAGLEMVPATGIPAKSLI